MSDVSFGLHERRKDLDTTSGVRMESDRIRMESDPDNTFLPYFNSDTDSDSDVVGYDAKRMSRIRIFT